MRYSLTSGMILAATIGEAVAGSAHAHLHRRAHENEKRVDWNAVDYDNAAVKSALSTVDWATVNYGGSATSAQAAATPAVANGKAEVKAEVNVAAVATPSAASSAAAPKSTASKSSAAASSVSTGTTSSSGLSGTVGGYLGLHNNGKAFGSATDEVADGDNSQVNMGNPQGSNFVLTDSTDNFPFTTTFKNPQSNSIVMACWSNSGYKDGTQYGAGAVGGSWGPLWGQTSAPSQAAVTFEIAAGGQQIVAHQPTSIGGCCETTSTRAKDTGSAFGTTYYEFTMSDSIWSAYDVSAIQDENKTYQMSLTSDKSDCVSSNTQNSWKTDNTKTGFLGTSDGSCPVSTTPSLHVTAVMGGN